MCIFAKLNIQMLSNNNSLNQFITTMDNNETSIKQFVLLGEDNSQYRDYAGSYFTKANINFHRTMKTVFRRSGIMKDNRLAMLNGEMTTWKQPYQALTLQQSVPHKCPVYPIIYSVISPCSDQSCRMIKTHFYLH